MFYNSDNLIGFLTKKGERGLPFSFFVIEFLFQVELIR